MPTTAEVNYLKLPPSNVDQWVDIVSRIRAARSLLLQDAEGFEKAAAVLEHIGQAYGRMIQPGLGKYKPALLHLIQSCSPESRTESQRLFEVVREARNTAVHDGAWVRHLGERLAELFTILETGVISKMTFVKDMMVRGPATAQPWQLIAEVRRSLLLNSFSYLPIQLEESSEWYLISDFNLVSYLSKNIRQTGKSAFSDSVGEAIKNGLQVIPAKVVSEDEIIQNLRNEKLDLPRLVVRLDGTHQHLVGIVTAFDLL